MPPNILVIISDQHSRHFLGCCGNEVVRIAAIVTLSQWGDEESRSGIEEAAKSDSFRLHRCAEMALKRLDRAKNDL